MTTRLSGGTRDFPQLSFQMFPYNEILKFSKVKSELIFKESTPKIPLNTRFQGNQSGGLAITIIQNLGLCLDYNTAYDIIMT